VIDTSSAITDRHRVTFIGPGHGEADVSAAAMITCAGGVENARMWVSVTAAGYLAETDDLVKVRGRPRQLAVAKL
jgi:hypothetical protein